MVRLRWLLFFAAAAILLAAAAQSTAQIPYQGQYNRGQDVVPVYEGWKPNTDGTFTLFFGYMNRNYQEPVDIPLGPDNNIDPGSDRGQPTHFYPRRQFFVFKVVVPKDWGPERRVVWTLNNRGKMHAAKGWLQPDWEINDEVMMQNLGIGGSDIENEAPVATGSGPQAITLPNSVALTATAQDDGRPRPRRARNADGEETQSEGLSIRWIHYRGPGPVTFGRATRAAGSAVTSTTTASFKVPGVYVIRAVASDGSLEAFHDITVTVK